MKRKEVCERTGLSQKALRLYEEKGLVQPRVSCKDHYKTRDYTEEDITRLFTIITLRKAMFTMSEIKAMLEDPQSIQTIYPQYLSWLQLQRQQLDRLIQASSAVDLASVQSAEELTVQIRSAADRLPIPPADIHFNFRKLDELEETCPSVPAAEDRVYRQIYTAMSREDWDNNWARWNQLLETRRSTLPEDSPVPTPPESIGAVFHRFGDYIRAHKRKCIGIAAGAVLLITLLAVGIPIGMNALWPVESMDGPSTEGMDEGLVLQNINEMMVGKKGGMTDYAIAPNKIYFICDNTLCSIDRDYTDFMELDHNCFNPTEDLGYQDESTCVLIYHEGYVYYVTKEQGVRHLMRLKTGTKVQPEMLWSGQISCFGLNGNKEIICRYYADAVWTETARIPIS